MKFVLLRHSFVLPQAERGSSRRQKRRVDTAFQCLVNFGLANAAMSGKCRQRKTRRDPADTITIPVVSTILPSNFACHRVFMPEPSTRAAIVTGSSRGIGAAVAERLAKDGFSVVVNYAGDAGAAEDTVRKIKACGGKAVPLRADVSDPAAVRGLFDFAETTFGGIDVLVNNAGIMQLARLADADDAFFD